MSEPMIVNIINFVRACEPRLPMDLVEPVREQRRLVREHGFPATWLLQYDALIDEEYLALLRDLEPGQEVGAWLEIVQPLVEDAGLPWRGRYPWDWHSHVAFHIGYAPAERERLVDVFMARFKATFGDYPRSVGSWVLDAHTLAYLADRYGIVAACNCKDQWGTDGYTLWGGYINQAYYPSRANVLMPAQHDSAQIPVPIFRMLGSDPIYQYDDALSENGQGVVTLEPVYAGGNGGGGEPAWVRWFFNAMIGGPNLSFGYAQVGQENSFGWPRMRDGLTDQLAHLAELRAAGTARVETLAESGAWFRDRYLVTPASAVTALTDWKGEGRRSVWYCSRHYRVNLLWEGARLRIRDMHLFDERYPERYLTAVTPGHDCAYDTLPLMEGFLWSDAATRAGIYPVDTAGQPLCGGEPTVCADGEDILEIAWPLDGGQTFAIRCLPDCLAFTCAAPGWSLRFVRSETAPAIDTDGAALALEHEGFRYRLPLLAGRVGENNGDLCLIPDGGRIEAGFVQ